MKFHLFILTIRSYITVSISFCLLCPTFFGCRKLVEVVPPITSVNGDNVFNSEATAAAVLTGFYTELSSTALNTFGSFKGISLKTGLSSDELTLHAGTANTDKNLVRFYTNTLASDDETYWGNCYGFLQRTNAAIEGLGKSEGLNPGVRKQLMGEAKFLRAFFHFYLVSMYGDVPLILSSDYRVNSSVSRTDKLDVYKQVAEDLIEARDLLSENYIMADAVTAYNAGLEERVRPSKWAATSLLARTYLYMGDWVNAEIQSSAVINSSLFGLETLENVFKKNNKEAIWQLQPVNTGWNTEEARIFILPANGPTTNGFNPVYLSNHLLNAFETGDERKNKWIGSITLTEPGTVTYYFPFKYQMTSSMPVTEYSAILRLGEQYLIRAEARSKQNKVAEAQADLNAIRDRAGLSNTSAANKDALLSAILHERQVELFTEWGHRWLDLKRMGMIDAVMTSVAPSKGNSTWNTSKQLYPIPQNDILLNPNLTQNPSY